LGLSARIPTKSFQNYSAAWGGREGREEWRRGKEEQ